MKKKIRISIVAFMFAFAFFILSNKVYATNTNYNKYVKNSNIKKVYMVEENPSTDITKQLVSYMKDSVNYNNGKNYVMIYVPSGKYYISDDNNLVLHSNTYFVMEDDTTLVKTSNTDKSIIRTRASENATNLTIYGGIYNCNGNGKHAIEIATAQNVTIENITAQNASTNKNGLNISNSKVTMKNIETSYNQKNGVYITGGSIVTMKNSDIYNNSKYGIYITDSSILKANDNAKNNIYGNNLSGVCANGTNTEIYLHKNVIYNNGKHVESGADGDIGHGVWVINGAYANITNNVIKSNSQCGIAVYNISRVKINKNTITGNGKHGIRIKKKSTIKSLSENIISNNSSNGILLANGVEASFGANNRIENNKKNGISLSENSSVIILNATYIYSNGENGIYSKNSNIKAKNVQIKCNIKYGVFIEKSGDLDIWKSVITENENYGINVSGDNVTAKVSNNIISFNKMGVVIKNCAKATEIKKNTINSNDENGIMIKASTYVQSITNNSITNNKSYGIVVYDSAVGKISGNIYSNNSKKNEHKNCEFITASMDSAGQYPEGWLLEFNQTLVELQLKFPKGAYWNHSGSDINSTGITYTPCNHYIFGEKYCNKYNGKSTLACGFTYGTQCAGFASVLSDTVFGTDSNANKFYNYDDIKIGDQARINNNSHTVFIIDKTDEYVVVAECNADYKTCIINWGRKIPRSELAGFYITRSE